MFKRLLITAMVILTLSLPQVCFAETELHKIEDEIGVDKFAHFGAGYFINDQLKRNTHLTAIERVAIVYGLAYAKERWVDPTFDHSDINATVLGAAVYEFKF